MASGPLDSLRIGIDVEIADVGRGSRRPENFVLQVLGVERLGVVDFGVGIRRAFLIAEYIVESCHGKPSAGDDDQYDQRNPHPSQNAENRESSPPVSIPDVMSPGRPCNYTSVTTRQTGISSAMSVAGQPCGDHLKRAVRGSATRS